MMTATRFFAIAALLIFGCLLNAAPISGQARQGEPELSVAGVKLGDRASGEAFLKGYQPRIGDGDQPTYYFYNKYADTVMKMTAASFDEPHVITEIEVFAVGRDYLGRHFQLKDVGYFMTGSGIFIGFRQSGRSIALALIVGVPNLSRDNMIGPKDVVERLGEPIERGKDGDVEMFDYRIDNVDLGPSVAKKYGYASHFEFKNRKLKRFSIKLIERS